MTFEGKVVAVTGAGGGIGTAIVRICGFGSKSSIVGCERRICKKNSRFAASYRRKQYVPGCRCSKEEDVKEAVSKIRTRFNRVDVLVNTAGIPGPSARTEDILFEDIKKSIRSECVWDFSDDAKYTSDHAGTKKVVQLSILDLYQECLGIHMKSVMVQARQRLFI